MFGQQKQIPRSPFASAITAVVHGVLGAVVWGTSAAVAELPKSRERLVHVISLARPEIAIEVLPRSAHPARTPALTPSRDPEPPKVVATAPMPAPDVAEPVIEHSSPVLPPEETPVSQQPKVVVGAFAERVEVPARGRSESTEVRLSGFESSSARVAVARREVSAIGAFESSSPAPAVAARPIAGSAGFAVDNVPRPQRSVVQTSADAGFASEGAQASGRAVPSRSIATGFDGDESIARTPAPGPREVATTGFAEAAASPPRTRVAASQPANRSVEVLYKPRPEYTEEARKLQIEGDVLLEVEFTADGRVLVLRVARGLGYGLDEMASRAVQQIRFSPALRNGVPVTSRASVNIVFRLT